MVFLISYKILKEARAITLDREKSEVMFYKIKNLIVCLNMMAGAIQNPDYVDENNSTENFKKFEKEYNYIVENLAEIKQEVEKLHNEIGCKQKI